MSSTTLQEIQVCKSYLLQAVNLSVTFVSNQPHAIAKTCLKNSCYAQIAMQKVGSSGNTFQKDFSERSSIFSTSYN